MLTLMAEPDSPLLLILEQYGLIEADEIAWREKAACRGGAGPEAFFPERGHSAVEAKAVCATCPVWEPCLEYALREHLRDGTWGGRTEKERRVILAARKAGRRVELKPPPPVVPSVRISCDCEDCAWLTARLGQSA